MEIDLKSVYECTERAQPDGLLRHRLATGGQDVDQNHAAITHEVRLIGNIGHWPRTTNRDEGGIMMRYRYVCFVALFMPGPILAAMAEDR